MEIISDKDVKTRKAHKCFLCNRKFEPGTQMNCHVNIYDNINRVYSCKTCKELMSDNWIEPNDENIYEQDTLSECMYGDNFSGTPEEYLAFKIKINSDRIKLQSECAHEILVQSWHYRNFNQCKSCEKLIRKTILT